MITNPPASALSVAENTASGHNLHTFIATDPDGDDDAIAYALTAGNPDCVGCGMRDNPYRGKLFRVAPNARITY